MPHKRKQEQYSFDFTAAPADEASHPATRPPVVYLISCTATKAPEKCAAKDLYTSDWFRKARAYVESTGKQWKILSALYLAVSPETVIEPYNFTLEQNDRNDRIRKQTWARQTAGVLSLRLFRGTHLVIFAGYAYREFLTPELEKLGFTVEAPLSRLGIGQQKHWFIEQMRRAA
jgi:hypothetical protein